MEYPVFICDDDQEQINQLNQILGIAEVIMSDEDKNVEFPSLSAHSYEEAEEVIKDNVWDGGIYFLDVELGESPYEDSGFDIAEKIKEQDERAQIIFVTSHADLSIITYQRRLGPVDYIVKSPNQVEFKKRVIKTLDVATYQLSKLNQIKKVTFSYKVGRHVRNVNMDDVIYIATTSVPHKLLLTLVDGESQFFGSINKTASDNPLLETISQSCLANPKNIEAIDLKNHRVQFVNGDVEDFSQSSVRKMKQLLIHYNYKAELLAKETLD